jgi:hypothetical protein
MDLPASPCLAQAKSQEMVQEKAQGLAQEPLPSRRQPADREEIVTSSSASELLMEEIRCAVDTVRCPGNS